MPLIPEEFRARLIANRRESQDVIDKDLAPPDHWPVVKLHCPLAGAVWLVTELEPDDNIVFCLADLGMGEPEFGYVSLQELEELRVDAWLLVEVDREFDAEYPLSEYGRAARQAGRIVT